MAARGLIVLLTLLWAGCPMDNDDYVYTIDDDDETGDDEDVAGDDDDSGDDDDGPAGSDFLYAGGPPLAMRIELAEDAVADIWADPYTYTHGDFYYEDEVYLDVGVRLKGYNSFNDLASKSAFKIKFDLFQEGQEFHGLERLTLNNMVQDARRMSEYLVYATMREVGVPAPRVGYVDLEVNGESKGLYALVETKDRAWVRQWFDDDSGNLYEGGGTDLDMGWCCLDLLPGKEDLFELDVAGVPDDRSDLAALIDAVNSGEEDWVSAVSEELDLARLLDYAAVEIYLPQLDGYTSHGNNYHLYRDPTLDLFTFSPWGEDRALEDGYFPAPFDWGGHVLNICAQSTECQEMYVSRFYETLDIIDAMDLAEVSLEVEERITPSLEADPFFAEAMDYTRAEWERVQGFLATRSEDLRAQLDDLQGRAR